MRQKVVNGITREERNIIETLHRVEAKVKELTGKKDNIAVVVHGDVRSTKLTKCGLRYNSDQKNRSKRLLEESK